jgi:hypothetical protein
VIRVRPRSWLRRRSKDLVTRPGDPGALTRRAINLLQETIRTGDGTALTTAVDLLRQAVTGTPPYHPSRSTYLSGLGVALQARFERTGDLADLDEAVTVGRDAVTATPLGHADRSGRLSNLSGALVHPVRADR